MEVDGYGWLNRWICMDGHIWVGGRWVVRYGCMDVRMNVVCMDGWMFEHTIKFYSAEL